MNTSAKPTFQLRGVHVAWAMAAFFATIIGVNLLFTIIALDSFPGEDVRRSYLQGLNYNDTLAERSAQRALQWRAAAGFSDQAGSPALVVQLTDARGAGVAAELTGQLRRAVADGQDRTLSFVSLGDGLYRATLPDLEPGVWDLRAQAVQGDRRFDIQRRLSWPPSTPR